MQNLIKTVTFSVVLALVSGCSYVGVYKRDLAQGNLITQDMVSQLETGMTKEQVRYIMGSPLLKGPFNEDRWDYVFYLDEAYDDVEEKRVTLTFQNGRLADIDRHGNIEDDVDLTPRPEFIERTGGKALYPSITAGEFLRQRLIEIGLIDDD